MGRGAGLQAGADMPANEAEAALVQPSDQPSQLVGPMNLSIASLVVS